MTRKQNKLIKWGGIGVGALILIVFIITRETSTGETQITVPVQKGNFTALVYSTGQLQAEKSVSIDVPSELSGRRIGIYEIKITQLVEEGTVVDSGQFVAALDQSAVDELMSQAQDNLEKSIRALDDAKIDTSINLSNLRDGLLNSKVTVEEKKLILTQSVYESPAVKRQASLDLERADRQYNQDVQNYDLKKRQDEFKVQRAIEDVKRQRETVDEIQKLFDALYVKAPQPGMVIYGTDRFGSKMKVGATVSRWEPQIATLPDLSSMISKTFINEIDISRVKIGQKVKVGIDAFPDKQFDGVVRDVANIGQVLPNGDSKVFEVTVKVLGTDPQLRPSMTTSNIITTEVLNDVTFIPLDAIFKNDSLQYVYVKHKGSWKKQIIDTGATNENYAIVIEGVTNENILLLNEPADASEMEYSGLDIYAKQLKRKEELEKKRQEELKNADMPPPPPGGMPGPGGPPPGGFKPRQH